MRLRDFCVLDLEWNGFNRMEKNLDNVNTLG